MILKMRKMDLLLYHREREKFLEELRGLGVVHITSEQPVDSAEAQELSAEVQRAQRVVVALKKIAAEKKLAVASAPRGADAPAVLSRYEECESRRDRIEQELASLVKDRASLEPWGDFDPAAVKRLAEAGVGVKFFIAPQKKFDQLDKSKLNIRVISTVDGKVHFAAVFRGEAPEIAAEEARLPEMGLVAVNGKIETLRKERTANEAEIEKMAAFIPAIEGYRNERFNGLKYEEAKVSMTGEAEGKLLKLTGWVPQKDEANVVKFLNNFPAYAAFRDPAEDENPPVELKNGGTGFSKLYEPVLGLYSLPGYREMDVAPFVAPFFTVFFGLCLGDAGYGLLVILAAIAGLFLGGAKMRPLMVLGVILGISTVGSGVLLNSFFGAELFGLVLSADGAARFSPLAGGDGDFPAMSLAFIAGFLQLFVGMGLQSYMQMRDRGFFAGLQPISTIFMATGAVILGARSKFLGLGIEEFAVGPWEIGPSLVAIGELPLGTLPFGIGEILVFGGLAMLLLFNNIDKAIFVRPLTGLWALYNFLTGFLSNILSYLRLFALGLAGGLLGLAVNDIAFMFVPDGNFASIGMAATVLILIGGHALNFGLSALGSFIHPLRLTFVEFYGAVGFNGGGKPYMPFAKVEQ